jgi:glycosyltransferase involved in cell wall biosynthesis
MLVALPLTASCRVKILFTSTQHTSFIAQDLTLLRKHFAVDHLITRGVFAPLKVFICIVRADVSYTWFASVYAFIAVFLARVMKKRSFVVIGGVDVARVPEMKYGIWCSPWKAPLVKYALRNATKVLAVDASLKEKAVALARYSGANIDCVPTGYDPTVWTPLGSKEPIVLTVAKCEDMWKMKVKGLDVLFECVRLMPETRFVVVGLAPELVADGKHQRPANVEIIPFIAQAELLKYYQRAKVYCQPSYVEGFPNSVCEAMLCECIPVGTNVGGIPTAMGNNGFLVPYGDEHKLADAIQKALAENESAGEQARIHIAQNFTLQKREATLLKIVREEQA